MKKVLFIFLVLITGFGIFKCEKNQQIRNEPAWIQLFNGKDLNDWKIKISGHKLAENYKNTFQVEDGVLKVVYDEYEKFNGEFGHLFYKSKFSNYKLRLEYRFTGNQTPGAPEWAFKNSGIMFHSQPPETMELDQNFPISIEFQLLGGNGTDPRPTGNLCLPGTDVIRDSVLVKENCVNSSAPTFHDAQWISAEVEVHSDSLIRHFINGELVLEYAKPQLDPGDAAAAAFIQNGDNLLKEGYIALQAESHPVEFRKVELMILE